MAAACVHMTATYANICEHSSDIAATLAHMAAFLAHIAAPLRGHVRQGRGHADGRVLRSHRRVFGAHHGERQLEVCLRGSRVGIERVKGGSLAGSRFFFFFYFFYFFEAGIEGEVLAASLPRPLRTWPRHVRTCPRLMRTYANIAPT